MNQEGLWLKQFKVAFYIEKTFQGRALRENGLFSSTATSVQTQ